MGKVLDTNDPLQSGRLRVFCPALGDQADHKVEEIPWAMYASPFGGTTMGEARGPGGGGSLGGTTHGMWSIPTLGSYVLVTCIDGDPNIRCWFACAILPNNASTGPHGRWVPPAAGSGSSAVIDGPLTNTEKPVEPLYSNQKAAFTKIESRVSGTPTAGQGLAYEWMSRAMDYSAAAITPQNKDNLDSLHSVPDKQDITLPTPGGGTKTYTPGYAKTRFEPGSGDAATGAVYDSSVYYWTTPGFHGFSMDDRPENCRIRLRTTSGAQILMDDTNERIYIQTAAGNNWIELDQNGNIDIYSGTRISISSASDINITSDAAIRMHAKMGIHMTSDGDIRMNSLGDTSITSEALLRVHATSDVRIESGAEVHVAANGTLHLSAVGNLNALSGAQTRITSASTTNIGGGGNILMTAPQIHANGPTAAAADPAGPANPKQAWLPNRTPEHEPWARTCHKGTDNDGVYATPDPARPANDMNNVPNKQIPEFDYDSPNIGKEDLGVKYNRNPLFNR
jgi:hypothetical protein